MTALRKLIQVLLAICLLILWTCNVDATLQWTMIEFFSGKGNVSKAFRRSGRHPKRTTVWSTCSTLVHRLAGASSFRCIVEAA